MEYATLALQFGFVTQFATAFPLAPLLSFFSNMIEIRGDAYKLCSGVRRPVYVTAEDIGTYNAVFQSFGVVAVMTNAAIIGLVTTQLAVLLHDDPGDSVSERMQMGRLWMYFLYYLASNSTTRQNVYKYRSERLEFAIRLFVIIYLLL